MRILLDTCVVIDALQRRDPFWQAAANIFDAIAHDKYTGYISAKSLCDIHYLMRKFTHDERVTRQLLSNLLTIFEILDTTGDDCKFALRSPVKDFEDAIMTETAVREHIDVVITRNPNDFVADTRASILTPDVFVQTYIAR